MQRLFVFAVSALGLLVGIGGLYFVFHQAPKALPPPVNVAAAVAAAQSSVPPPMIPAPPPNVQVKTVQRSLVLRLRTAGGNFAVSQFTQPIPQVTGNTPAELKYQQAVDTAVNAHAAEVQNQATVNVQQQQARAPTVEPASNWITTVLIPLIATVAGFMTALAGLINAFRTNRGNQTATS